MDVIYTGIFFDKDTYNTLKAQGYTSVLSKHIDYPHVTLEFKPKSFLPNEVIGKEVEVTIVGEGNDGQNHGYEVMLPKEVRNHYRGADIVHITMSIDHMAKAVNTANLNFKPITKSFTVKGKVGYFTKAGVKYEN